MELDFIVSNNEEYQDIIQEKIKNFNIEKHPEINVFNIYREKGYNDPLGIYVISNEQVIGGIIARKKMQWLDIDILFVNEEYRGYKLGTKLLNKAAEYCEKEELIGMHLFTLDFQAKGFYEKQGFKLISEIPNWPKGITRYEFIKYISY